MLDLVNVDEMWNLDKEVLREDFIVESLLNHHYVHFSWIFMHV